MKIRDMPFYSKPDFKILTKGSNFLDDAELLAIILERGNSSENAIELSYRLLKKYNLSKLSSMNISELKRELNDNVKAMKILSLFELSRRHLRFKSNGFTKNIKSAKDVFNIFHSRLINEKKENFVALYLDSRDCIIKEETISVGTVDSCLVHPREVFRTAITESACSLVLVHNHPSGNPSPSPEDEEVTDLLVDAGELLNIKVKDHVIIGCEKYFSFREFSEKSC